ncbi:MAG: TetR/AcrR family transcriptional regulator [Candidatus Ventricola sp.]
MKATSMEDILRVSRQIVAAQGLAALSMRAVADGCQVALGTLYHYVRDKDELVMATVGSIWQEILGEGMPGAGASFPDAVVGLFACVQRGAARYPGFLTAHAACVAGEKRCAARREMERCLDRMRSALLEALCGDARVARGVFDARLTEEALVELALDNILMQLAGNQTDCTALAQLLRLAVYR